MINEFRASFTEDLAKPSRFDVNFNLPIYLNGISDNKTLSFRCENAVLPGRTLSTTDVKIYGPIEKYPYQSSYDDASFTFIVDDSMSEKQVFSSWMYAINPHDNWNFEFKSNYCTNIQITQYNQADDEVMTVELVEAFPISVSQMDLDWSNDSTYHKLNVTFAYTYWYTMSTPTRIHSEVDSPKRISNKLAAPNSQISSNPWLNGQYVGEALSIIPTVGGTKALTSIIGAQGVSVLDVLMDQNASAVNSAMNSIGGLTNTIDPFKF